jgi:hypothetical protein
MKDVYDTLLDFVDVLNKLGLRYAVMGGLAVGAFSIPRPTWDVDLTIGIDRDDLSRFFEAVEARSYSVPEAYTRGWLDQLAGMPLVKFKTYCASGTVDIDVFIAENDFQKSLLARSTTMPTEVGPVSIVTAEDLRLLKLIANRPLDLIDVADLLFIQGPLDETYLRQWGRRLGVLPTLEEKLANPPTERP